MKEVIEGKIKVLTPQFTTDEEYKRLMDILMKAENIKVDISTGENDAFEQGKTYSFIGKGPKSIEELIPNAVRMASKEDTVFLKNMSFLIYSDYVTLDKKNLTKNFTMINHEVFDEPIHTIGYSSKTDHMARYDREAEEEMEEER